MRDSSSIKIRYVDGIRYSRAVFAGCQEVISHEKELNQINVFPIPDNDTGLNLKRSFQDLSSKISFRESSLSQSSRHIAEIVESSSLGYSGTVFAGFFSGFADGVKGLKRMFIKDFSYAAEKAQNRVYKSFEKPVEGTVLSVIKAWSECIKDSVSMTEDFYVLLEKSFQKAVSALKKTPDQLAVLKKNRVVDAGGKAFVYFLKGIVEFIEKGVLTSVSKKPKDDKGEHEAEERGRPANFCVECCVRNPKLDRLNLIKELNKEGKDLIFYSSVNFAKIHIRTQNPERVFDRVSRFGNISSKKIWDCSKEIVPEKKKPFAVVSDTTCDIPEEYVENHDLYFVPVKFHAEDQVYTDKVDIIPEEFYKIMESSPQIPKTSKPSIQDFMRLYSNLLLHYRSILSVNLSGELSGTYQTALQAAKNTAPQKIKVLNSKNLSVGLGLIVMEGVKSLKTGKGFEEVLEKVKQGIRNTEIFIGIPTLKYLIKGGRVTKTKGSLAKIFHINPILSLDSKGALKSIGKARGRNKLEKKILSLVFQKIEKGKEQKKGTFLSAVVHVNAPDSGRRIEKEIKKRLGNKPVMVMNASPVLGAHSGPGTIGVAVLRTD